MFEVLEMENRAVENRKAQKEEEIASTTTPQFIYTDIIHVATMYLFN